MSGRVNAPGRVMHRGTTSSYGVPGSDRRTVRQSERTGSLMTHGSALWCKTGPPRRTQVAGESWDGASAG